jgi:ribonucleoside-diphosphate reductase alpha chain
VKGGSVQHLTFLSEEEKNVFKTFGEISQKEIVIQAGQRQKYIDQAQSLNLMIPQNVPAKDINLLLIEAWKLGVKTLYYQRSTNPSQELSRNILDCKSCES